MIFKSNRIVPVVLILIMLVFLPLCPGKREKFSLDHAVLLGRFKEAAIIIFVIFIPDMLLHPKEVEIKEDALVINRLIFKDKIVINYKDITCLTAIGKGLCERFTIHTNLNGNYHRYSIHVTWIENADEMIRIIKQRSGAALL